MRSAAWSVRMDRNVRSCVVPVHWASVQLRPARQGHQKSESESNTRPGKAIQGGRSPRCTDKVRQNQH